MTGPITPHLTIEPHLDGVSIALARSPLILPADMARAVGELLITYADQHDPKGVTPLPIVTPKGDPIR